MQDITAPSTVPSDTSSTVASTVSPTWYTDFFTELPNEFWRRAVPPEATAAEVDFVVRRLGLAPGSRILDVPCGSGRHTVGLATRGHRVLGLDISVEAVEHARLSVAGRGLDVEFVLGDMRRIPDGGGPFDAAVCMGNSFGYLGLDGTREFADALGAAVRPGGGLVVDFAGAAESLLPAWRGEPRTMVTGDITVVTTSEYDVATSRVLSTYEIRRGEETFRATALHHVYTSAHLARLLTDAGFTGIEMFADPEGTPYRLGSGRLLVTAVRRG
jgi:SAM-dependent methyltransferase